MPRKITNTKIFHFPRPYIGIWNVEKVPCYGNVQQKLSVTVTFKERVTLW